MQIWFFGKQISKEAKGLAITHIAGSDNNFSLSGDMATGKIKIHHSIET